MARIKNTVSNIRRRIVAVPLMIASFCIVLLVVLYLLDFRSQGVGVFKTRLDQITDEYETTETTYNSLITSILKNRAPVPDFTISVITESYQSILIDIADIESTLAAPDSLTSLKDLVFKRQHSMTMLQTMNTTLRAEEEIGNSLTGYNSCKRNISYNNKASQIIAKLEMCKLELDSAIGALINLPTASIEQCPARKTPAYYLQQTLKAHQLFVASYTYTSKGNAKAAASTELEYQRISTDIRSLGDWNMCISEYLETTAQRLLVE